MVTGMGMSTDLPGDASSAAAARRIVEAAVPAGQLRQDALIVVSELAANAWRHGDPPFHLVVQGDVDGRALGGLQISISNRQRAAAPSLPERTAGGRPDGLGGRGIDLVATVAQDWGWHVDGETMTVWARLVARP